MSVSGSGGAESECGAEDSKQRERLEGTMHRKTFHEGPDSWFESTDSWFESTAVETKTTGPEGSLATIDFVILLLETAPAINKVTARKGFAETFRRLAGAGRGFAGLEGGTGPEMCIGSAAMTGSSGDAEVKCHEICGSAAIGQHL